MAQADRGGEVKGEENMEQLRLFLVWSHINIGLRIVLKSRNLRPTDSGWSLRKGRVLSIATKG